MRVLVQILERIDGRQDGVEDVLDLRVSQSVIGKVTHTLSTLTNYVLLPTYLLDLRVLVDEHERVRHVGVAQVDQGRANPAARGLGLHAVQQRVHGLGGLHRRLHALQTLASVTQLVGCVRAQQVLLGEAPGSDWGSG